MTRKPNRNYTFPLMLMALILWIGCKGYQIGHIIKPGSANMVGSHSAGSATYDPLIDEAVAKLLSAAEANEYSNLQGQGVQPAPVNICFVGIENKGFEELGDFKDQLYEKIDTQVNEHILFNTINRNYVDAGIKLTRLRREELFIPSNMQNFVAAMQSQGQPFNYMLYAKLTSGTTLKNNNQQRDYLLTLSLVDVASGQQIKQSAEIKKGYHKNVIGRVANYNPFKKQK